MATGARRPSLARIGAGPERRGRPESGLWWMDKHHEEGLELTTTHDSSVSATLDTTSAVAVMTALIRGMSSSTPGKNRGTRGRISSSR